MGILTLPLLAILVGSTYPMHRLSLPYLGKDAAIRQKSIRELGMFALVFGIFSQLLGLLGALQTLEEWGPVTLELLTQGVQTSFIPALYGLLIALVSRVITKARPGPKPD
ncbi:MAG: MotA/TolQ/ExbB proton channel family protein [Bacteroidota bacterium]